MSETTQSSDGNLRLYGIMSLAFLTVLFMHVTRPLADMLIVVSVYGYEGYQQGIEVVGLYRHSYFSNGADLPAGSHLWAFFGSAIAAAAIAWFVFYVIRCGVAHLPGPIGPRLRGRFDQMIDFRRRPSRPAGPMTSRQVGFLAAFFFGGSLLAMFGPHIWRGTDLALHERRTQGVVVRQVWPGAIIYRYSVAGREHSGAHHDKAQHTYSAGSTVEVRYSSRRPGHSTLGDPLELWKSVLFAAVMISCFISVAYFEQKRKQRKTTAEQIPES